MLVLKEAWREDSQEPVSQYLPPGSDPQDQLGQSHQVSQFNSVQKSICVNLDAAALDSRSG